MPEALIAATARTSIGRAHKGSLAGERPDDLLAFAIESALARAPEVSPAHIDDVIVGCGYPQQEQGYNVGRRASLLAGLPVTVPGVTVSRFCASSLQATRMAFHAIKAGEGDAFVVGGVESVSRTDRTPRSDDERHPKLRGDGATLDVYMPMGQTAENVAERFEVPREEMDRYAQRSQERAVAAQDSGFFHAEIAPYPTAAGELAAAALEPEYMGVGPIEAIRNVLRRAGMTLGDIDVLELNEAFAAQVIPVCRTVGIDPFDDRVNPHGGAIALGHPFGMTGARILATLINGLQSRDATIGLETMCVAQGQGMAMIVERLG